MTPERWADVERLYHAALARDPGARAAFIVEACAGDEALRHEVESLLAQESGAAGFLSTPPVALAGAMTESGGSSFVGQQLGPYQIQSLLGAGGMGEVYRAHDRALERDVAIKILPRRFTSDPDRLGRFKREARMLAALNHPNIGAIYGLEDVDGIPALVLELVEGRTLAERLALGVGAPQEPRLSMAEALTLARQIADALAAAHARGVVHRDLKPANIAITPAGVVKVLDFGLAKAAGGDAARPDLSNAPTATVGGTRDGTIVGTAAYMSPEQARGQAVDTRTDIWAFGCVVFEMLVGRQVFGGDTVSDVIVAILTGEPDWRALPADTPAPIHTLMRRCLEKDRTRRLAHIADARLEIDDALAMSAGAASARLESAQAHVPVAPVTTTPPRRAIIGIAKRTVTVSAVAAVLAFVAAAYLYLHRPPKLTDKDTLVLADFTNTTGDPVFDGTLRQGLSVQLGQSPFLSLVSDQRIQGTLRLMGQPVDTPLTPQLAKDICERTASAAVLEGSIARLGSQYVLGLRANNCATGDVLDEQQMQTARKEDVLSVLSQMAVTFRTRVGESLATVEKHSTPLQEATTSSLEALNAYSAGIKVNMSGAGDEAGISFFRRAVEIDPKFAIAYANLGLNYSGIGESVLSAESTTMAWQLRERASSRERFFIEFTYDRQVTGNLEKAYQTLESWLQTYPRGDQPPSPHDLLGGLSAQGTGRFERAIEISQKEIATHPDVTFGYGNLASSLFFRDRFSEAESTLQRAFERKLENTNHLVIRYDIALLQGDRDQMDRAAARANGKRGAERRLAHAEALALARSGHLQAARWSSSRAVDLATQEGDREAAASYRAARAVWEAVCGNGAEAKKSAMEALTLSKGRDVQYAAGLALARSGDSARSEALTDDLEKRFPEDTFVKFTYAPLLRALAALERRKPEDSVERLQIALPYELAANGLNFARYLGGLHSAYVRGEAFIAEHRYAEAAAEFQKILDHRGIVGLDPIGALASLQLGRAFALSGDTARAKAAYEDFLTLWKNADADIPILKTAKAEYATFQNLR